MMVELILTKRVGLITVPVSFEEAGYGHQLVFHPGNHLDTPLVTSRDIVYTNTVREY